MLPYFQWLESHGVGGAVRNSPWLFPVIEAVHLLAFAAIGGAVLVVSLRLLGIGVRGQPAADLLQDVKPWFLGSLVVMVVTGISLFLSVAVKCYYSYAFWIKMGSLALALVLTAALSRKVTAPTAPPLLQKVAGFVSLILWAAVAWGGRWIGFS